MIADVVNVPSSRQKEEGKWTSDPESHEKTGATVDQCAKVYA